MVVIKQKMVDVPIHRHFKKQRQKRGEDGEHSRGGADQELTGMKKWKADFEESLLQIKDDYTFYVHG